MQNMIVLQISTNHWKPNRHLKLKMCTTFLTKTHPLSSPSTHGNAMILLRSHTPPPIHHQILPAVPSQCVSGVISSPLIQHCCSGPCHHPPSSQLFSEPHNCCLCFCLYCSTEWPEGSFFPYRSHIMRSFFSKQYMISHLFSTERKPKRPPCPDTI